jgi:hypothetical protein
VEEIEVGVERQLLKVIEVELERQLVEEVEVGKERLLMVVHHWLVRMKVLEVGIAYQLWLGRSSYGRGKLTCETESNGGGTVTSCGSEMPSTAGVNLACSCNLYVGYLYILFYITTDFTRSHRYATVKDLKEMRRSFHVQTIHVQMKTYQYLLHLAQLKIQSVLFVIPT